MRWECRERFPRHIGLAIPTCITARTWRTYRDACRDRKLADYFEAGGGENFPGIPGACSTRNFNYLKRGLYVCFLSLFINLPQPNTGPVIVCSVCQSGKTP